jgi:hypothetical protein
LPPQAVETVSVTANAIPTPKIRTVLIVCLHFATAICTAPVTCAAIRRIHLTRNEMSAVPLKRVLLGETSQAADVHS